MSQILSLDELVNVTNGLKKQGQTIVHCHGVFDLLHPGHVRHLQVAKQKGAILVVTVTPDEFVDKGPNRPAFNQQLRIETLAALECIDYVALNKWPSAVETIKRLKPNIFAKGQECLKDPSGNISKEEETVRSIGGELFVTSEITFSSSRLINEYLQVYTPDVNVFLKLFRQSHCASDIISELKKLKDLKVLVLGDAILDEYCYCETLGKPRKANILASKFVSEEIFAGGAFAVANHLAGFCNQVHLATCVGAERDWDPFARTHLARNITFHSLHYSGGGMTTTKRRYIDYFSNEKLFEICYLDEPYSITDDMLKYLSDLVLDFDVVIVSDFGHGLIDDDLVDMLCSEAKSLCLNVQTNSSNFGFNLVTKFKSAHYICLAEPEIRLATNNRYGSLIESIKQISDQMGCARIAVTLGRLGSLVYNGDSFYNIPAFTTDVIDTIGAGDAYFAVTSLCVAATNLPMDVIGFLGNAGAGLKIRTVGNRTPIDPTSLHKFVEVLLK